MTRKERARLRKEAIDAIVTAVSQVRLGVAALYDAGTWADLPKVTACADEILLQMMTAKEQS